MIGLKVKVTDNTKAVQKAVDKGNFRSLTHASASISKDMKASLVTAEGPSDPGSPPHTHKGAYIRRAVRYHVDKAKQIAVIGPMHSIVGEVGGAHERGEVFRGTDYPERPFALPTLERAIPRLGGHWKGSVGQ